MWDQRNKRHESLQGKKKCFPLEKAVYRQQSKEEAQIVNTSIVLFLPSNHLAGSLGQSQPKDSKREIRAEVVHLGQALESAS